MTNKMSYLHDKELSGSSAPRKCYCKPKLVLLNDQQQFPNLSKLQGKIHNVFETSGQVFGPS